MLLESKKKPKKNKKYKNKWYYFLQSFSKFLQILFFQKFLVLAEPFQCYFFLKVFIFSNANIINLSIKKFFVYSLGLLQT